MEKLSAKLLGGVPVADPYATLELSREREPSPDAVFQALARALERLDKHLDINLRLPLEWNCNMAAMILLDETARRAAAEPDARFFVVDGYLFARRRSLPVHCYAESCGARLPERGAYERCVCERISRAADFIASWHLRSLLSVVSDARKGTRNPPLADMESERAVDGAAPDDKGGASSGPQGGGSEIKPAARGGRPERKRKEKEKEEEKEKEKEEEEEEENDDDDGDEGERDGASGRSKRPAGGPGRPVAVHIFKPDRVVSNYKNHGGKYPFPPGSECTAEQKKLAQKLLARLLRGRNIDIDAICRRPPPPSVDETKDVTFDEGEGGEAPVVVKKEKEEENEANVAEDEDVPDPEWLGDERAVDPASAAETFGRKSFFQQRATVAAFIRKHWTETGKKLTERGLDRFDMRATGALAILLAAREGWHIDPKKRTQPAWINWSKKKHVGLVEKAMKMAMRPEEKDAGSPSDKAAMASGPVKKRKRETEAAKEEEADDDDDDDDDELADLGDASAEAAPPVAGATPSGARGTRSSSRVSQKPAPRYVPGADEKPAAPADPPAKAAAAAAAAPKTAPAATAAASKAPPAAAAAPKAPPAAAAASKAPPAAAAAPKAPPAAAAAPKAPPAAAAAPKVPAAAPASPTAPKPTSPPPPPPAEVVRPAAPPPVPAAASAAKSDEPSPAKSAAPGPPSAGTTPGRIETDAQSSSGASVHEETAVLSADGRQIGQRILATLFEEGWMPEVLVDMPYKEIVEEFSKAILAQKKKQRKDAPPAS